MEVTTPPSSGDCRLIADMARNVTRTMGFKYIDIFEAAGATYRAMPEMLSRGLHVGAINIKTCKKRRGPTGLRCDHFVLCNAGHSKGDLLVTHRALAAMIVDSACRSHSARSAQRAERQGSPGAPLDGRGRPCRATHLGQYALTPYLLSLRSSLLPPTPHALGL